MLFASARACERAKSRAAFALRAALIATPLMLPPMCARTARADAKAPSAERIRSAAEEFDMGRRAFVARAYADAAVHFENAYSDAPRAEALRNAIRARRAAKEEARAATLASLAGVHYGSDAVTMALVNETLADLSPRLQGINLGCEPECGVAADGRVVSVEDARQSGIYLEPGKHELLVSWSGDRTKHVTLNAIAGKVLELRFTAPARSTNAQGASLAPTASLADRGASRKPFGPAVFITGTVLTLAGAAATVVSGLDAQSHPGKDAVLRDCVGQGESCPTYQAGKSAELRTNVLLGATAGVALVTLAIGVFFTQWRSPPADSSASAGFMIAPLVSPVFGARGSAGAADVGGVAGVTGRF
jgi:hypothetical protein